MVATMKMTSDTSISTMPPAWPGVPGRIACGGYSVQPAPVGPPVDEEARHQHHHRQQVDPEAQHVEVGKHHVPRAHHQRNQVVAEAAEEQRRQQVDHHDHPVHGHELVVALGVDELELARKAELQPHQVGQHHAHQPDRDGGAGVLDRDHLVVLAPDIVRQEALRVASRAFIAHVPLSVAALRRRTAEALDVGHQRRQLLVAQVDLGHHRREALHLAGLRIADEGAQVGLVDQRAASRPPWSRSCRTGPSRSAPRAGCRRSCGRPCSPWRRPARGPARRAGTAAAAGRGGRAWPGRWRSVGSAACQALKAATSSTTTKPRMFGWPTPQSWAHRAS